MPKSSISVCWVWDFGGQDIYHGTHALFLKSRALFALVWTPTSEELKLDEHDDFRNQPLQYWLAYVHTFGGLDSPMLVIQAQCDQLGQESLRPPVPDEQLASFPFRKLLHYSAKTDRGRVALDEALAHAVRWLQSKHGCDKIGNGRAEVKARLEKRYTKGKKLITQTEFRTLCKRVGNISSPLLLLEYLHNIGTVFYRQGLFGDAIILDQAWALEAIYAVFDRESKAFRNIERYGGRFRRSDLAQWVWQKHGKEEQELFLNLMQQCGICFVIREGDEASGIEPIYVAPDLLPERDDAQVESALKERWYPGEGTDEARIFYELLPPGLMRTVIAKIGEKAGIAGEYWRDGFYFYDERKNSRVLVEQRRTGGWAGEIVVQIKGGEAEALLDEILRFMDDRHALIGACPSARIQKMQEAREVPLEGAAAPAPPSIKPGYEPSPGRKWAISYAWGDNTSGDGREREVRVDDFCAKAAAKGITILRDKTTMRYGDRISQFMERIGGSDRIFVFLSDKYLRSAFCMHELFDVWRNCRADDAEFIKRTRVYLLPCASISTFAERTAYVRYWREQFEAMEEEVARTGLGALARADLADYRHMQDFVNKTPDMLRLVLDVLSPRSFEDFLKYSLDRGSDLPF